MKFVVSSLTRLYTKLVYLYPVRFRAEFGEEMQVAFQNSLNDAIKGGVLPLVMVCLRELCGLPFSMLREFLHELRRKEFAMLPEDVASSSETSATPGQVTLKA